MEQLNLFDFQNDEGGGLTPRQWALYRLIKKNTLEGRKTTQREICDAIEGYHYSEKGGHDCCPTIWADIFGDRGIDWSPEIQKTIICEDFQYWIGDEEEVSAFLDKLWNVGIAPRLKRFWAIKGKIKEDGQGQLLSCRGEPIYDDSKARGYVEAFLDHAEFE